MSEVVLHQIIAVEKGVKNRAMNAITEIHKSNQKADAFSGITRTYTPIDDQGEKLPPENVLVQRRARDVLKQSAKILTELFDVTAQRDFTNCNAKADVTVDGVTILSGVPATHLLFLEKQLIDVRTLIGEIPTLDPAHIWTEDVNSNLYSSNPIKTTKTKKVEDFVVVVPATKEHPAQSAKVTKDVTAGTWETIKLSGALPTPRKEDLLERVEKLIKAVKFAREAANGQPVAQTPQVGDAIFGYLFR